MRSAAVRPWGRTRSLIPLSALLSICIQFAAVGSGWAQSPDVREQLDAIFADLDRTDSPGCVVGVGQDGRILHLEAYGMANLEHEVPLTPETIVEIGSVSKQFAAGAVVLLAQRGKLSLDDDVQKWIPELPDFGEDRPITIRHLAQHTSGLRGQWDLFDLKGTPRNAVVHNVPLIFDLILQQRALNFPPNDQYSYSNSGYTLLNVIVQRASGQSLADFSRQHLFRPLGMMDTEWRDDFTRVVKRRMQAYSVSESGEFHLLMPITNTYANGGLLTTVSDMIRWTEALHADRIGDPGFRETMTTPATLNDGRQIDYALGLRVTEYHGLREVSHGGSTAGYRANLRHFPEEGLTVALGCNVTTANAGGRAERVVEILLADHTERREPTPPRIVPIPAEELRTLAGLYRNPVTEQLIWLESRNDRLFVPSWGGAELLPVGEARFHRGDTDLQYLIGRPQAGEPVELRGVGDEDPNNIFVLVPAASPSAEELREHAGDYYSPELDVTFTMDVQDGELVLRRPIRPDDRFSLAEDDGIIFRGRVRPQVSLSPTFADGFTAPGFRIVFTRDAAGRVDGLEFFGNRVRHLRFDRR